METLLYGKVQHLHKNLKEKLKSKNDDDLIFAISAADTPETPEEALAELEQQLASEMKCGRVDTIRRTNNTVEMAHEYAKSHGKEEVKLPERFKRHAVLFSDEEAKKFPLSRPHDHKIELTDKAPASFNMKMYPMLAKVLRSGDLNVRLARVSVASALRVQGAIP